MIFFENDNEYTDYFSRSDGTDPDKKKNSNISLSVYGTDLTKLAREGKLDQCYGREKELTELMEILVRRQKNNPVLVGDAGVGKSAIVELFASKLVNHLVPFVLTGRRIISLDLGRVVAGSRYRGEFEGRFRRLLDEALRQPNVILFIDEIHTLSGTGSAEGSLDAANMLKPILARNGFQCIGATTHKEYEIIEKDPALHRRFQPITVNQPTVDETVGILNSLRTGLEAFHNLEILSGALQSAAELSHRYINDRYLPDKAIDLVDRAAAKEVIKITDVQQYSLISGLVNGALRHVSQLKNQAFRFNDISSQFVFQELENAYRNFLFQWVDIPGKIPSSTTKLTKKDKKILRSPLSQDLFNRMRQTVLARTDELLYSSIEPELQLKPVEKTNNLSKEKIEQICVNFQENLQDVQISYLKQLFLAIKNKKNKSKSLNFFEDSEDSLISEDDLNLENSEDLEDFEDINPGEFLVEKWDTYYGRSLKKVTSLARISYFIYELVRHYDIFEPSSINVSYLDKNSKQMYFTADDGYEMSYYTLRKENLRHSSNKRLGVFARKYFHTYQRIFTFSQFTRYAQLIRHRINKKTQAHTLASDFFKQDIETVTEVFEFFKEIEATKVSIIKDFLQELRPMIRIGLVETLNNRSVKFKLTPKELQRVFLLLGYYNTETGRELFSSFEQSEPLKKSRRKKNYAHLKNKINSGHIKQILADLTGIPIESISISEQAKLQNLEQILHERVIGQDDAVAAISRSIRRARLGFQNPNRPIASFLFCGPTGVGKTEICKALAYVMFGSEKNMVRFDMSEFMEKFTVSRLIGSPPGYVGYEEGGQLSDTVRKKPYSVVLFDEVEKAHPDVLNILLQILEDGRLTDTQKRLISFENTIIIMTSNAGAGEIQEFLKKNVEPDTETVEVEKEQTVDQSKYLETEDETTIRHVDPYSGVVTFFKSPIKEDFFSDMREEIQKQWQNSIKDLENYQIFQKKLIKDIEKQNKKKLKRSIKKQILEKAQANVPNPISSVSKDEKDKFNLALKNTVLEKLGEFFLPEFLNRLDDIIIFRPLKPAELREICDLMLNQVIQRFQNNNITLTVEDPVRTKLSREGYNPAFGARPLRRLITRYVEDLVSETILNRGYLNSKNVEIAIKLDQNNEIYASTMEKEKTRILEKKKEKNIVADLSQSIVDLVDVLEISEEPKDESLPPFVSVYREVESDPSLLKAPVNNIFPPSLKKYFVLGEINSILYDPKIPKTEEEMQNNTDSEKKLFKTVNEIKELLEKLRDARKELHGTGDYIFPLNDLQIKLKNKLEKHFGDSLDNQVGNVMDHIVEEVEEEEKVEEDVLV